jgi:hypothetical protein
MEGALVGNCKDCKWWQTANHPDKAKAERVPLFEPIHKRPEWGICERTEGNSGEPESAGTLAFAWDFEQYGAELVTAPDFGCVMFEEKNDLGD